MPQLTQIRQKIKSIVTTKKITHAVRLVSMSMYSRLEKQKNNLQNYTNNLFQLFNYAKAHNTEWKNKILMPRDILDSKPLLIIVSTTKGLCGSLNANLFKYIQKTLILENHQKPEIITVGLKSQKFIPELNLPKSTKVILSFNEIGSSNYLSLTQEIIKIIYDTKKNYSSVVFFSTKIKNFFAQTPHKTTIIPTSAQTEETKIKDLMFTENSQKIIDSLAKAYIKSSISDLLFDAILSEQAARFLAMDSATNNADNYLEQLTLQYNKTRQALITREVSELSSSL